MRTCRLMQKRYVTPEEGRQLFPSGALWLSCTTCGAPLLVPAPLQSTRPTVTWDAFGPSHALAPIVLPLNRSTRVLNFNETSADFNA